MTRFKYSSYCFVSSISVFFYEITCREQAGPPTTAVCGMTTVSQLMRSRPSPTSSATPTLGIKSDDSIHSVFYRGVGEPLEVPYSVNLFIPSPTAACEPWGPLSLLVRSRPSPISSATPTLGIKSDNSIHSVSYRAVWEPWGSLSQLIRSRPSPTSFATPTPGIKSDDSIHSVNKSDKPIHYVSCHAVCKPWGSLSQLMRSRPQPTSSATPTLGIKSNDSIHSASYHAVCEPWSTLSHLTRSRPQPTSSATPTPGIKAMIRYIPSPTALSVSFGVIVSADESQTPTYKICHTYASYQKR